MVFVWQKSVTSFRKLTALSDVFINSCRRLLCMTSFIADVRTSNEFCSVFICRWKSFLVTSARSLNLTSGIVESAETSCSGCARSYTDAQSE